MDIDIQPGRYVLAVSGGVDSVLLLHLLAQLPKKDYQCTVAHFDHGIRRDSAKDRTHVAMLAKQYDMPFVYNEGALGAGASEAEAREARYTFLHAVRRASNAQAVVTAHHQDDAIETAILNVLRGTGRKGLSSLTSTDVVKRPLLHVPKTEIRNQAKTYNLSWREDSTNTDLAYKRNYIRHTIVPKLTMLQRQQLVEHIRVVRELNAQLDAELDAYIQQQSTIHTLDRRAYIAPPHAVALELLATWLRQQGVRGFDRKGLQRIMVQAKTLQPGQKIAVQGAYTIVVHKDTLQLIQNEQ